MQECKNIDCRRAVNARSMFYCSRCFDRLWNRILIDAFDVHEELAEGYVGRSGNPTERHLWHLEKRAYPLFSIVHWAHGIREADFVERIVAEELSKNDGGNLMSDPYADPGPRTGYYHCIYIAWKAKPRGNLGKFQFRSADELRNIWPVPFPNFETLHFRSTFTRHEAERVRKDDLSSQRAYSEERRRRRPRG